VVADSVLNDAYSPGADSDELLARLESVVLSLQGKRNTVQMKTAAEVLGELTARFQRRREGVSPGIPTGFADLDKKIGGLQPGEITTTAARPGMGKSAKVANEIEHIARIQPYPVAVFSLEMDAESLMERMVCGAARVDGRNLKRGTLADWEWDAVAAAVERLADLNVLIFDATEMTAMQMRAKVRGIVAQHGGIGAFAVDYLQIVDDEDRKSTRQEVIRRHMQTFRRMAKESHCPGMILAQLNRECEKRENKRPLLSDLAEAGAIEQESHVVQFIFREEYYRERERAAQQIPDGPTWQGDADNTAEIIIAKNRNGPTGTVKLAFIPEFARFENLA
jgi:replicative DNA helicase